LTAIPLPLHRDSADPIRRFEEKLDRIGAQVGHLAEKVEGHDASLARVESGLREVLDSLAALRAGIEDAA